LQRETAPEHDKVASESIDYRNERRQNKAMEILLTAAFSAAVIGAFALVIKLLSPDQKLPPDDDDDEDQWWRAIK
jgi:hypothetical protein